MIQELTTGAIVLALVEVVKMTGRIPSNYLPITAVGIGAVLGVLYGLMGETTIVGGLLSGVIGALVASGAYDNTIGLVRRSGDSV